MWHGNYRFFDYKYNIDGYHGQDYMSPIQYIMCGISLLIVIVLLILLRKVSKEKSKKILLFLGIFITVFYLVKTAWESYWDIKTGRGFNMSILPFDLCSLIMPTLIIAGLSKKDSKLEVFASTFIATIGFAGGVSNMIFLRGLNYYPMFTFGALYSLTWHASMIFAALFIPVNKFHKFRWIDILNSMVCLLSAALIILPYDYIMNEDFMFLNGAGGIPLIEDLGSKLVDSGLRVFASLTMLLTYLLVSAILVSIYIGVAKLGNVIKTSKTEKAVE